MKNQTIKLNIYEKGQIKKTLETNSADIMYGTVEDMLNVIQLEKLDSNAEIAKMVVGVLPLVKHMLLDVFPDCTEEDLRCTKVKELVSVVADIVKCQITDLNSLLPNQQGN